jgi:hypothetical protein
MITQRFGMKWLSEMSSVAQSTLCGWRGGMEFPSKSCAFRFSNAQIGRIEGFFHGFSRALRSWLHDAI